MPNIIYIFLSLILGGSQAYKDKKTSHHPCNSPQEVQVCRTIQQNDKGNKI